MTALFNDIRLRVLTAYVWLTGLSLFAASAPAFAKRAPHDAPLWEKMSVSDYEADDGGL